MAGGDPRALGPVVTAWALWPPRLGTMTSDDEKDPPVPADVEGAAKRIHRSQVAEESDANAHEAPTEDPGN